MAYFKRVCRNVQQRLQVGHGHCSDAMRLQFLEQFDLVREVGTHEQAVICLKRLTKLRRFRCIGLRDDVACRLALQ